MIKFINKSIRQKIFIITSIFLFLSSFAIYFIIYTVLPSYYIQYKKDHIAKEVKELIDEAQDINFSDAKYYLGKFAEKNNSIVIIVNNDGEIEFTTNAYLSESDSYMSPQKYIMLPGDNKFPKTGIPSVDENSQYTRYRKLIYFKDENAPMTILVHTTLQPIDDASTVILSLAPVILGIILVISSVGSYFYTRYIADPIVKVNKTARKMAKLDFETRCVVKSNDEIGEISNSLNELSKSLKNAMDELEQKNRELKSDIEKEREIEAKRREFVATISHELKSPIAAAKGQIEGMINNIGIFKDREKYLRRSYMTINSMEKLVKEILDMSKFEDYNFKPVLKDINLSELIEKVIVNEEFLRISKEIKLTKHIEKEVIVPIDETLILKAITNIINNALKYSPKNEELIVSLKKNNDKAVFEVINTGVNIDKADIKEIFKAFYRVEKSRNRDTGGSGLGLYIVSSIFSSHNVEHSIKSEDNKVIFTVNFHL